MASQGAADSCVSRQSGSVTTRSVGNQCFSVGQMIFFNSIVVMNPSWGKAPSWLSTPAARSESDSNSDNEDDDSNSNRGDDGAPHTSPGMNNDDDDDDDDDDYYPDERDHITVIPIPKPDSRIGKVKKNIRKRKSKLNRIKQIALKAKNKETMHINKSLKHKQLQKGSHSRNRPANNDDDDSDSDDWHWVD